MISACFGPVPWEFGPQQLARDGEDYAFAMLPEVAEYPFEVWCDCAAPIACALDRHSATSARTPQAHLWCRFFGTFDDGVPVHKTKAHASEADVQAGRTTPWERKANAVADTLAKRGAAMHPDAGPAAEEHPQCSCTGAGSGAPCLLASRSWSWSPSARVSARRRLAPLPG